MPETSLRGRSALELAADVRGGKRTARDQVRAIVGELIRAEASPDTLRAFISYRFETAMTAATEVDTASTGSLALAGVPVAVKDNICTLDYPTTCASRILADYRSPFEATVIRKLRAEGAVVVGKTNLDEFAMGSSTEYSAFGPTRNPYDRERVPGGTSGGSAAAVAAGLVPLALGSDTGGSVRQPAAFCGVVGIKPTYGRVSRYGLVAHASSLDQIGTFGRSVADAATLLQVISGHDPLDSTSAQKDVPDFAQDLHGDANGLVVGVPDEYFTDQLDPGIAQLCRDALERLRGAGAVIRPVSLPHTRFAVPAYYVIATAEASSNLARYDGVRYGMRVEHAGTALELYEQTRSVGFGPEVKRRIMLGTYALSAGYYDAYYARALRVRALVARDFQKVFRAGVDVIFTPTTPSVAFRFGEKTDDPYQMYLSDIYTVTANLAGIPGVSLPIGRLNGLPVGGQFLADRWNEPVMVRAAAALERAR